MNQCEKYNTLKIPDLCKLFEQKNQIWTNIMEHLQPQAKCPLKPSVMKLTNATLDFSLLSYLPIDGYTWVISFKVFKPIANVRHKKQMIFCIISEATVTKKDQKI